MDKPVVEKTFSPPTLVLRIFSGGFAVMLIARLVVDPTLRNALWVIALCPLLALNAISPKAVRDGRLQAWERRHPVVLGATCALHTGIGVFLLCSWLLDDWLSLAISVALGPAYGVLIMLLGRRRQRVG